MALIKPSEHLDMDSIMYRNIFSDKSKPFSERLDSAVQYANQCVKNRIEVVHTFYIFQKTGCIPVSLNISLFDTPKGKCWIDWNEYQKKRDWENSQRVETYGVNN